MKSTPANVTSYKELSNPNNINAFVHILLSQPGHPVQLSPFLLRNHYSQSLTFIYVSNMLGASSAGLSGNRHIQLALRKRQGKSIEWNQPPKMLQVTRNSTTQILYIFIIYYIIIYIYYILLFIIYINIIYIIYINDFLLGNMFTQNSSPEHITLGPFTVIFWVINLNKTRILQTQRLKYVNFTNWDWK